jgi:hypothetical protein
MSKPIHIKSSHEGRLHQNLGVPAGKKIPSADLAPDPHDSPALAKQKVFAKNAKSWGK